MILVKLDENLSRHLADRLKAVDCQASTAAAEGLLGRPDTEVGAAAKAEGRVLFTLDVEFADLRKYPPGDHPGIVLFRPRSLGPLSVNAFVEEFVRAVDLRSLARCVVIAEPDRIRVRRPPASCPEP